MFTIDIYYYCKNIYFAFEILIILLKIEHVLFYFNISKTPHFYYQRYPSFNLIFH